MAIGTTTELLRANIGNRWLVQRRLPFSGTYTVGGEAITPGMFGLTTIEAVVGVTADNDGFVPTYDRTNKKVKLLQGDNPNAAAAPLVERTAVSTTANVLMTVIGV